MFNNNNNNISDLYKRGSFSNFNTPIKKICKENNQRISVYKSLSRRYKKKYYN